MNTVHICAAKLLWSLTLKLKLLCSVGNCENSFVNKPSQLNRDDTKAYVNNVFSDGE